MTPLLRRLMKKCGAKNEAELRAFGRKINDAFLLLQTSNYEAMLDNAAAADYESANDYASAAALSLGERGFYKPREMAVIFRHMPESPFYRNAKAAKAFCEQTGRGRRAGYVMEILAQDRMKCALCEAPTSMHTINPTPRRGSWHPFSQFASSWFNAISPPGLTAICDSCALSMCHQTKDGLTNIAWNDDLIVLRLAKMVGKKARNLTTSQPSSSARDA